MRRLALILVACSLPSFAQVVGMNGVMSGPGTSVTNSPVSLVLEHKQEQTLADGTHISTITHEYFYRDSLGRTRSETEFPGLAGRPERPRMVTVQDPVADVFLNWQTGQVGGQKEYNRVASMPARQSTSSQRSPGLTAAPSGESYHRIVEVPSPIKRPDMKHEDLGVLDVQGASCKANRITTTYPVDFFGNDRPITTVQEQCRSTEFNHVLQERYDDPRNGTRTISVQSISRGEPDPSLFQPPAGYTERAQPSQQGR